jgi:hypothetical protein
VLPINSLTFQCQHFYCKSTIILCQVDAIVVAIPRDKDLTRGGLATSIHQKDPNIQRQLQDSKWPDEATGSGVIVCQSNILASRYVFFIHLLKYTDPMLNRSG